MAELAIILAVGGKRTRDRLAKLLAEGYHVDTVAQASELRDCLGDRGYDLALVSDDLPDAGPLEAVVRIRDVAPELRVIILAGEPSVPAAVQAMRGGAYDYVAASAPGEELLGAASAALEARRELLEDAEKRAKQRLVSFEDLKSIDLIDSIMKKHGYRQSKLVGILQDIQKELRYLPTDTLRHVAERLGVPLTRVYGVATFYQAFSLSPRGRHTIKVCVGTACHVRGAPRVLEELQRKLGIGPGETTYDMEYTLLTVNCLGCCALGPVVVVDDTYHSVKPWQTDSILGLGDQDRGAKRSVSTHAAGQGAAR